ncbi:MAG: MBL fold metallo-hydrolase [Candidatus Marinimicrobia bacterium]|nr:MBL fold metallo-hydrolase [Candidatus Neomarinimicrobiota bacterium]
MKIDNYTCYSIETSRFGLDGGAMFGIIPKTMWEKEAPADNRNRIEMVTRSLLLISDDKKIIIDTGNGSKWQEKFKKIYSIDTDTVNMESSLAKVGLSPNDITDVICTHMHFDHIGGNTTIENNKIIPVFQNATHWFSQDNWDLANSPSEKDQGSFMEADWKVLAENGMVKLIPGTESFLPGIDILVSNGHTLGQIHPIIRGNNQTLMYCGDLIPMSAHIPIPWIMAYDIQPMITIQEKRELLPRIVDENWILFFEHDPNVEACTVEFDGRHYHRKDKIVFTK